MKGMALAAVAITCGSHAAPAPAAKADVALAPVAQGALCVTHGQIDTSSGHLKIRAPSVRAVAVGSAGDDALLSFTYVGPTGEVKALASGDVRRQIGLKLRAENGCNLLYVMWRIEPKAQIVVSLKRNPGATTHRQCGTRGYRNLVARAGTQPPALGPNLEHRLHAKLDGRILRVWADRGLAWEGDVGDETLALRGPAGVRSDNGRFDVELDTRAAKAPLAGSPLSDDED